MFRIQNIVAFDTLKWFADISFTLSCFFVTGTVASDFLSADSVSEESDDGPVPEPVADEAEGDEVA